MLHRHRALAATLLLAIALLPLALAVPAEHAGAHAAGHYEWPLEGRITRGFTKPTGPYGEGGHQGLDIACASGAAVRSAGDGTVDWVSGACFLIRRDVFESIGGFDERYFMFAEDMALCWQVREHGHAVAAVHDAAVTHIEGLSRQRASRAMLVAHHAGALRFEWQTAKGLRRLLAPLATLVLGLRLGLVLLMRPKS